MIKIHVLSEHCKGPNAACRAAHSEGFPVHVIEMSDVYTEESLVMPSWHFRSVQEGTDAITRARETAPTVWTDADLHSYRARRIPHKLPIGWIDPTMRRN